MQDPTFPNRALAKQGQEQSKYLPDGVTGPETNPLGDGTVLSLGFGKLLLGAETLVALIERKGSALASGVHQVPNGHFGMGQPVQ